MTGLGEAKEGIDERTSLASRLYEKELANRKASVYEHAVTTEWAYRYEHFTAYNWGLRFREPFLDFGCGTGLCSNVLETLGREVVAFDISKEMIRLARKRCKNVSFVLADALNLPFVDESFPTVCVIGVLHHILELDQAFNEIRRVSEEVICINEPVSRNCGFAVRLVLFADRLVRSFRKAILPKSIPFDSEGYHSRYERNLDAARLIELCEKRELKVAETRYYNHLPFLRRLPSEKIRMRVSKALISPSKGTDVEIIALKR